MDGTSISVTIQSKMSMAFALLTLSSALVELYNGSEAWL